jgi:hypothetical protein
MSPPRVITPRLEAAITEASQVLDDLIAGGESVIAEQTNPMMKKFYQANQGRFVRLRGELLEAFEEARADAVR